MWCISVPHENGNNPGCLLQEGLESRIVNCYKILPLVLFRREVFESYVLLDSENQGSDGATFSVGLITCETNQDD